MTNNRILIVDDNHSIHDDYIKILGNQLGLKCTRSITEFIDVQYQPKGKAESDIRKYFGSAYITQIENICGDAMREFGYDLAE